MKENVLQSIKVTFFLVAKPTLFFENVAAPLKSYSATEISEQLQGNYAHTVHDIRLTVNQPV